MNAEQKPTDWRSITIVWLAGTVASLALLKASPAGLDLRTGLSLSLSQLAWVSSIFTLMTVALGVFVGSWGARFGARNVASLGLIMLAIAGAATTLTTGPTMLIIGRLVEGTGFVLVVVCAPTLIASLAHPRDGRLVLGIWAVYVPAGGIVVMLAAPLLLPIGGWRALWWLGALCAVVALALLTRVPTPPKTDAAATVNLRRALGQPKPWFLAAGFACITMQLYAVLLFAPTYLVEELGYSLAQSMLMSSVILVMAGVGGLSASALMHRGVSPALIMVVCLSLIAGLVPSLLLFAETGLPALLLLASHGLLSGCAASTVYAQAPGTTSNPAAIGIIMGLIMAGNGLGILVGPPLVASVIEATGSWQLGTLVPVIACVCGVLCVWWLSRLKTETG
ncbi:MAG: MFS transporter [Gammaproteobacteria bacterium]|nr:MFS transporter [Gammaproteobacteria bacterium]